MKRVLFSSLRTRLMFLACLTIVPAMGLLVYSDWEERQQTTVEAQQNALRMAHLVVSKQADMIEETRQLLGTIAQFPEVRDGDPTACNALIAQVAQQQPRYSNIGVVRPSGDIFCSAIPISGTLNIADRSDFQRALRTRDFAVGEYQIGRLTAKAVLPFSYPILDSAGNVRTVVSAGLDQEWFQQFAIQAQLPADSMFSIIDANGTSLARYPESENYGKSVAGLAIAKSALKQSEGTIDATDADGIERLVAFTPLELSTDSRTYVAIGIPSQIAFETANAQSRRNLVACGLALVLALAVAWFGSDLIFLRKLNALVRATRRLAAGDLSARSALVYNDGEIGQLARGFDEMARSIEQREEQRSKAEMALRESEDRYRDLFEHANDLIQCVRPDGRFVYTNRAWRETLGYGEAEIASLSMFDVLAPSCHEHCGEIFRRVMSGEKIERVEAEFVSKDGRKIVVEGSINCRFENGQPVSTRGIFRDMTERKQAEQAQRESEERYRTLFEHVPVGLYRTTPAGRILDANPALAKILGFLDVQSMSAANAIDLYVDPNDRIRQQELLQRNKDIRDFDMQLRRCDGSTIWVRDNTRAVRAEDGHVLYHEGSLEDITIRKHAEEQFKYMSSHDILTGLYNRSYFEEERQRLVKGRHFPVSILMTDVDALKAVNDSFGHAAGDELLKQVARALRASFRPDDVVARLGGDEFAVLLPNTDAKRADEAVERVRRNVLQSGAPNGLTVSLSVGAATAEESDLLTQAMKIADDRMYEDKRVHKKTVLEIG